MLYSDSPINANSYDRCYNNLQMAESVYAQTFKEYDKDNSGFIDKAELGALLKTLFAKSGLNLDESATAYYLQKFDTSQDGKISLQEFVVVM